MDKVSPSKLAIILEYLQKGGKAHIDGRVYVWLDNHVVRETETEQWVIDGLATEGRMYSPGEDYEDPLAGRPHYMGCRDMTIEYFFSLIDSVPLPEYQRICLSLREIRHKEEFNGI